MGKIGPGQDVFGPRGAGIYFGPQFIGSGTSFFELIFDGNDFYNLPAFTPDFDLEFDLNLASAGPTGAEQSILNLRGAGNNVLTLIYYADGPELDLETITESVVHPANLVGSYHTVRVRKQGFIHYLYVDGILIGSLTDSAINPTLWTTRFISGDGNVGGGTPIRAGGKIKDWNGSFSWPALFGIGPLKVYQDAAKTMQVTADGQNVAVIETPDGDVMQAVVANQGTIDIAGEV